MTQETTKNDEFPTTFNQVVELMNKITPAGIMETDEGETPVWVNDPSAGKQ